jgi:hypothetical protein
MITRNQDRRAARLAAFGLLATLGACSSGNTVSPTRADPTAAQVATPTPRPTPTPTPSCIASVTPVMYDPDHTTCPFSGGTMVVKARFDLTAAANQSVTLVGITGPDIVFNFNPEEVRAGRTERINLRYEFQCIKLIGPRGWFDFGPFTLKTSCGSLPLTTGNRLDDY